MNDDVSSLQSSHTHSHFHEDVSMWNLSYDCHAIKNRKNRKKIRIELSLLILSFYKETFIFPGTHTHINHERMQRRKESMMTMQLLMIKKWNIESAESSHASTLFELKFFCEIHVAMFNFLLHAEYWIL